jgi:hypothetical protein
MLDEEQGEVRVMDWVKGEREPAGSILCRDAAW